MNHPYVRCCPRWLRRRPLRYRDGTPRPLLRGTLHGFLALIGTVFTLAILTEGRAWLPFAAFMGLKTVTMTASAFLHLYPFKESADARRALVLDLLCVPCSIWGNTCLVAYTPVQPSFRGSPASSTLSTGIHIALGVCFLMNALLVRYQFSAVVGKSSKENASLKARSDAPRMKILALAAVVSFTSIYVLLLRPLSTHPNPYHKSIAVWCWLGLGLGLVGAGLAQPVTISRSNDLSWTETWPWRIWHVKNLWGLHEDMHVVFLLADVSFIVFGFHLIGLEW